jgi:hypothetical protein
MKKRRKPKQGDISKRYQPSEQERAVVDAYFARKEQIPPAPRLKVVESDGVSKIDADHPHGAVAEILLMEALGTTDVAFLNGLLTQLANAGIQGKQVDDPTLNFMLSVVKGIAPRDQLEAMLAAQMAAVHMATMTFARRLAHVETIPQQDSAERAFNKLARTFASQLEALNRHRGKGQQKVIVEHVHVHAGGQAVVGTIETPGGGDRSKSEDQPHAKQIAHAPQPTMWSADKEREPVPVTSDAERPLPDARRTVPRGSEGQ